jgi:hypothetical protein
MGQVDNIISGWYRLIFKDEKIEAIAKSRADICFDCEHKKKKDILVFLNNDFKNVQDYICDLCNCPLSAKIRSLDSKCDLKKW